MTNFDNIYYRPFLAHLAHKCPSSMMRNPDLVIREEVGVRADLGTACHELFKSHVVPRFEIDNKALKEAAERNNVELDGFEGLAWRAKKMEKSYSRLFDKGFLRTPSSEETWDVALQNGYTFHCRPDLYELSTPWAVVVELKTGEKDVGWMWQAKDYAMALYRKTPGIKKVFSVVFAPVLDYYDVVELDEMALENLEAELLSNMEKCGKEYKTNLNCEYCPNLLNCPAIKRQIDPISKSIMKAGGPQKITGADIQKWRPTMKAMKKIWDVYDVAEKLILKNFGVVDLGDGTELYNRETYVKVVDAGKAISVLCDNFNIPKEQFIHRIKVNVGDINELAESVAPPRGKTRIKKDVWEALKTAKAFKENLTLRRATRKITVKKEVK